MSELELLVGDALDAHVPLRLDRLPVWDDVLVRAGIAPSRKGSRRIWRPRSRRLVLAFAILVLAVVIVGSALAALGKDPFGRIGSWLGYSGGRVTSWLGYSGGSRAKAPQVFVARPNGTTHKLVRGYVLSWSPDGSRLLVSSGNTSSRRPQISVDVVRADGSSDVRVIPTLNWLGVAKWSPDSRRIAYDNPGPLYGDPGPLSVVNADGTGRKLLVRQVWGVWSWSSDGSQIVYAGRDAGGHSGIFLVNTNGTPRPTRIDIRPPLSRPPGRRVGHSAGYASGWGTGVVWSPDQTHLAFQWDDGTVICCRMNWIAVMRPDGRGARLLARGLIGAWSPDSRRLAFTLGQGSDDFELWVMDADGTHKRLVCQGGCAAATWFPDDSKLAYLTRNRHTLVVVRRDGSGRRIVARSGVSTEWGNPVWFSISPDGSTIAYAGGRGLHAGGDLYLVNADGSHRRLIARASTRPFGGPAWRPARTPRRDERSKP